MRCRPSRFALVLLFLVCCQPARLFSVLSSLTSFEITRGEGKTFTTTLTGVDLEGATGRLRVATGYGTAGASLTYNKALTIAEDTGVATCEFTTSETWNEVASSDALTYLAQIDVTLTSGEIAKSATIRFLIRDSVIEPTAPEVIATPSSYGFHYDMHTAAPTALVCTRTGSTLYAQQSATTALATAANAIVWEDRADGNGGGVWSFPAYTNIVTTPFDFTVATGGWTSAGSPGPTVTADDGTAPDGTLTADKVHKTGATFAALGRSAVARPSVATVWVKDAAPSPAPAVCGSLSVDSSATMRSLLGYGGNWRRVTAYREIDTGGAQLYLWPTGQDAPAASSIIGAVHVWGAQKVAGYVDVPTISGSSGACLHRLPAGDLNDVLDESGDLDITISLLPGWRDINDLSTGTAYLWAGQSAEGEMSLRITWDASVGYVLVLRVHDDDVLTTTTSAVQAVAGNTVYCAAEGDEWTVRAWYRPSLSGIARSMGIRSDVNGALGLDTVGVATADDIGVPTDFYIGGHGTLNPTWIFPGRCSDVGSFVDHAAVETFPACEGVVAGDSITASNLKRGVALSLLTRAQSRAGRRIFSLTNGGAKWAEQLTAWQACPYRGLATTLWVSAQMFTNDFILLTDTQNIAAGRAFFADVTTSTPLAKRIIAKATPQQAYWASAPRQAQWVACNDAAAGVGADPITNVDGRVIDHVHALDDGTSNLYETAAKPYGNVDQLHTTSAGDVVQSAAYLDVLQVLLPVQYP